ncbi:MAG TPA: OmpA family protein [Crenalkalicoccus sp.]|nr:OmpA family protein [Crenalkalicoccus sp.]
MLRRPFLALPALMALAACQRPAAPAAGARRASVFFTQDSAGLDESSQATIAEAARAAAASPGAPVTVLGFAAPDTGTTAFNRTLAQARAQNVADALVAAGVPASRIRIQSRGAVPFDLVPTESRRVEIVIGG